ncbi:MAG: hypothetical protein HW421_2380 [Ignavibacteria bacterium]|nr:hypothetical protein [Ignavibacteria bacterium]
MTILFHAFVIRKLGSKTVVKEFDFLILDFIKYITWKNVILNEVKNPEAALGVDSSHFLTNDIVS